MTSLNTGICGHGIPVKTTLVVGGERGLVFDFAGPVDVGRVPKSAAMGDAQLAQKQMVWTEATKAWNQYPTWAELRRSYDLRMIAGRTDFTTVSCGEGIVGMEDGRVFTCEVQTPDTYFDQASGPWSQGTVVQTMLTYEFNNDIDVFEIALSGDRGNTWTVVYHQPHPRGYGIVSWKHTSNVLRTRHDPQHSADVPMG